MAELGRQAGRKTSEAKKAAARKNGRKGGRPRKTPAAPREPPLAAEATLHNLAARAARQPLRCRPCAHSTRAACPAAASTSARSSSVSAAFMRPKSGVVFSE